MRWGGPRSETTQFMSEVFSVYFFVWRTFFQEFNPYRNILV